MSSLIFYLCNDIIWIMCTLKRNFTIKFRSFTCQEPGPGLSMGRGRLHPPKHLSCPPYMFFILFVHRLKAIWSGLWVGTFIKWLKTDSTNHNTRKLLYIAQNSNHIKVVLFECHQGADYGELLLMLHSCMNVWSELSV